MTFKNPSYKRKPFGLIVIISVITLIILVLSFIIYIFHNIHNNNDSYKENDSINSNIASSNTFSSVPNNNEDATTKTTSDSVAKEKIKQAIYDANKLSDSGDYKTAIDLLKYAQNTYGNDENLLYALNTYCIAYKTEVINESDELAKNEDYIGAIEKLNDALSLIDDNEELLEKKESYEQIYASSIIMQTDELLASKEYDKAAKIVDLALSHIPNSTELKTEKERIQQLRPVYLLDEISPYQSPYHYEYSDKISMGGNYYAHGFTCMGYTSSPLGNEMYFNLNAEYLEMSFVIGIVERNESKRDVTFSFFEDGEFIEEYTMKSSDLPLNKKIDVSGCKQLKIAVYDGYIVASGSGTYGVAEIEITRNFSEEHNIIQKPNLAEGQVYLLDELSPYQHPYHYECSDKISMGGYDYSHGFTCMGYTDSAEGQEIYVNLNAEYSEMSFIIGIVNRNESERNVTFSFFEDGTRIVEYTMKSSDLPEPHTIDVNGCKQLKIVVYDGYIVASGSGTYGITEIVLTKS